MRWAFGVVAAGLSAGIVMALVLSIANTRSARLDAREWESKAKRWALVAEERAVRIARGEACGGEAHVEQQPLWFGIPIQRGGSVFYIDETR